MVATARGLRGAPSDERHSAVGVVGMRDRKDRERDRVTHKEEDERRAETDRRGEELREAWRQRHPEEDRRQSQGDPRKTERCDGEL